MAEIRTDIFKDELVLYFDSKTQRINAYTLASVLVSLADAIKRANTVVNPGYEVEVVVEAIGPGSFKAVIRTIYNEVKNLFSTESLRVIILSILATFIYENALAPGHKVNLIVNDNEVVVVQGNDRIIVPRELHEATQQVARSGKFQGAVSGAFQALDKDPNITGFGLSPNYDEKPSVVIPKDAFPDHIMVEPASTENERHVIEIVKLTIVRAILERSDRKWQFIWAGVRISAAIDDDSFYDRFDAHRITIAPGDSLLCEVEIHQKRDEASGVFANTNYRITRVLEHIRRPENPELVP